DIVRVRDARRALWPAALEAPDGIKRLAAIDYYERIALAGRARAIRDFEAANLPPRGNEPNAPDGRARENEPNAQAESACENEPNGALARPKTCIENHVICESPTASGQRNNGHSRRSPPRHQLPLRSARRPRPAGRAPAAGAALPHARRQLFAQGDAGRAFRELAAGSERQL